MKKLGIILRKEWKEVFKNRMVLFTVIFLPLIMTALPLGTIYATGDSLVAISSSLTPEEGLSAGPSAEEMRVVCDQDINTGDCMQYVLVTQFLLLFMLMPLAIPATFAAYSIVGEKTTRSLEPLLAAPLSTLELLAGKSLAAVIPAVLATWGGFVIFAAGAWLMDSSAVTWAVLDPMWLLAIFIVGPLMAVMSVLVSMMVSSRVNDPRAAEQISMLVILPLLAVLFGQIGGWFMLNRQLVAVAALVLLVLDGILLVVAEKVFERETILTRWK